METPMLSGTVMLTNTKEYPFNNSVQTVALEKPLKNQEYTVLTEVFCTDGDAGGIVVSDRASTDLKSLSPARRVGPSSGTA